MSRPTTNTELDDRLIVKHLLARDSEVTGWFLFKKCYPLFKALHDSKHPAGCDTWADLAKEVFIQLLTPTKSTGRCPLENFEFKCSLTMWLKIVTLNFCNSSHHGEIDTISLDFQQNDDDDDRFRPWEPSLPPDNTRLDTRDVDVVLSMVDNERYREMLRLQHIELLDNTEIAERMNVNMDNFYNIKRRANEKLRLLTAQARKEGKL
ncbi:MAG: sigma-70 family RNA polymerase sigma factor [Muribaculaceae bacterium]|nr:sigma-70 family RNA polymerase sigma factor [Muribaculaceae bacterium]